MELHVSTIGLLGERASLPNDPNVMVIDSIIRWMDAGCPRNFLGESSGGIRFRIINGDAAKLFYPVVVSELAVRYERENRSMWHQDKTIGPVATVLEAALSEVNSIDLGEEAA